KRSRFSQTGLCRGSGCSVLPSLENDSSNLSFYFFIRPYRKPDKSLAISMPEQRIQIYSPPLIEYPSSVRLITRLHFAQRVGSNSGGFSSLTKLYSLVP